MVSTVPWVVAPVALLTACSSGMEVHRAGSVVHCCVMEPLCWVWRKVLFLIFVFTRYVCVCFAALVFLFRGVRGGMMILMIL